MGVEAAGETPSLKEEFIGETHMVLEHTQNHVPGNQHQKGPICLWEVGDMTENLPRAEQAGIVPFWTPCPHMVPQFSNVGCPILVNTNRCAETKKYGPNE